MAKEMLFNPWVTPKLIFRNCTQVIRGFAIPFLTVTFTVDGKETTATRFSESGKSTDFCFETPATIDGFIKSLKDIGFDVDKYLKTRLY